MEALLVITNKHGQTYKRHKKPVVYDDKLFIRLPKEEKTMFDIVTKKNNKTMTEQIRIMIQEYIKENI